MKEKRKKHDRWPYNGVYKYINIKNIYIFMLIISLGNITIYDYYYLVFSETFF